MKSFLFIAGLSVFTHSLHAADWNQYRGPNGDGKSSESIDADSFQSGMQQPLWKVPTNLGFSSFAVSGDAVYTVIKRQHDGEDHETCIALDSETGEEKWAVPLSSSDYEHDGGNAGARDNRGGDGPRNTPTVDGKHVYVYDGRLVLSCLNTTDGSVVWKHDVVKEFSGRHIKWYNATSPLLYENMLFVSGGGPGETFIAFDKDSGKVLWKTGDELMTHATPHIATIDGKPQVIFFMQSGLVALAAETGELAWTSQFPFSVSTAASPISNGNQVYCSAGYGVGAGLFSVNDTKEADEVWFKPNELMNHWSTPVVHNGHLYGIFEFKKYGRAPLQCVELSTGEIKWSHPGFGPGNCILVNDQLVVLSDTGKVTLVKATPKEYREMASADAIEGKCWSTPAFSNGRLYVRSTQEGACFDLAK